ncbi:hypothetical protein [Croceicoccus gelatinilyticus]|nr:hypothetical protein [Croceicoccus gelatinilyticus]MBS7671381.1 hypothetical protein [Croceicoccus gelatinilyticus]
MFNFACAPKGTDTFLEAHLGQRPRLISGVWCAVSLIENDWLPDGPG